MGPDPFNMPGAGVAGNSQALGQAVNQLAPLAPTWHGPLAGPDIAQVFRNQPQTQPQSNIGKFTNFVGHLGSEIGHMGYAAGKWLTHNAVDMAEAPVKLGEGLAHGLMDRNEISTIQAQNAQFTENINNLNIQWKSGKISKDEYVRGLKSLNQDQSNLVSQSTALTNRTKLDQTDTTKAAVNTAATLVTILTAGFGKAASAAVSTDGVVPIAEKGAADWLSSVNANSFLSTVEKGMSSLAEDPALFEALPKASQTILQRSLAEVMAGDTASMSAGQIARASAANLALKYPIYYNALSSTGAQIYNELDNKKYGDAVRTIAFNAALTLTGGAIGQAWKFGGKALGGVSELTFGKTAFWDELSKYFADGSPDGFKNVVTDLASKMKPAERREFLTNLSAVEATNTAAMGGDAKAAAYRVANGLKSTYGFNLSDIKHEEAIHDMVNFANAQRLADNASRIHDLGPITVGRVDARQLDFIARTLAPFAGDTEGGLKAWEIMKATHPSWSWANNANFDKQISNLISNSKSFADLAESINSIKASFSVKGFPEDVSKQLSKMGYIPIKPVNLEAPFVEGTGKLTSKFGGDGIFLKSVQPLPVLGFVGDMLTKAGLSPQASTEQVYQLFNKNLSMNLQDVKGFEKLIGQSDEQNADLMIKKLTDYIHNPTRGKIVSKMPISDYRMLTTGDIKAALDVSGGTARDVQKAIAQAYFQVPLAVRGLGDKLVDAVYRFGPSAAIERRYLRVMGAARFAWNPFFQYGRVIPKTEILTESEGGGYISSIFTGRAGEINKIREGLRTSGFFEEKAGFGSVLGGEAVDYGGAMSANLTKKLLPMQERSIAGLIDSQAQRMGMGWEDYIKTNPQNVRDTIQAIAGYPKGANFLNSPMARTLNIAFFPFRFEAKVAGIMGNALANTSTMTQIAVVKGLMQAHGWLNSPEGQAWYSKNSEAIGLFKYISPLATMNEVAQSLLPGHDHSLGNFGELGGLPFGWIPQLTDAEGLTNFHQPGVDPKTGKTIPNYIPITLKGQAAIAIQDLLSSLFSYPGATVGLPSKASITRSAALGLTGASKKTDLQLVTPDGLSSQQQSFADTIQGLSNSHPAHPQALPQQPMQPGVSIPKIPSLQPTFPTRPSASGRSKRLKKSQFTPQLLPGQTQLGQLP